MIQTNRAILTLCGLAACSMSGAAFAEPLGPNINLKPHQSLTGAFTHEHPVEGFKEPVRTQGRFTVDGDDRIVWAIEKPMMTTTTITNAGLTQSVGQYPILTVPTEKMPFLAQVQQNLLWALSGKWDRLKQDFTIQQTGSKENWQVTFVPKDAPETGTRKPFKKLVANGAGPFVEDVEIVLPSGVIDRLRFSEQKISP